MLLELGGKAPLIVLDDADLDEAVKAAAFGAFMNQGQICMSTERIVVDAKVADAFVEKLAAKAKSAAARRPARGQRRRSARMVGTAAVDRVQRADRDAVAKGGKLVAGDVTGSGTIMPATIVDHVTPAHEHLCATRASGRSSQ